MQSSISKFHGKTARVLSKGMGIGDVERWESGRAGRLGKRRNGVDSVNSDSFCPPRPLNRDWRGVPADPSDSPQTAPRRPSDSHYRVGSNGR